MCDPLLLPKIPHFHCVSEKNAWSRDTIKKLLLASVRLCSPLKLWFYRNLKYWCCTWGDIMSYSCIWSTHYTHLSKSQLHIFHCPACLRLSHQLILLICGRRSRKGCSHRVCCSLVSPISQLTGYCVRITGFFYDSCCKSYKYAVTKLCPCASRRRAREPQRMH